MNLAQPSLIIGIPNNCILWRNSQPLMVTTRHSFPLTPIAPFIFAFQLKNENRERSQKAKMDPVHNWILASTVMNHYSDEV